MLKSSGIPRLVDEFEDIFSGPEQDADIQEDITAWRSIFRDSKANNISPILRKYGWKTESKHLPKSQGEGQYLKWTSITTFANWPRI